MKLWIVIQYDEGCEECGASNVISLHGPYTEEEAKRFVEDPNQWGLEAKEISRDRPS